jgi:hypothetical protein
MKVDPSDTLYLDGKRLIHIDGTYGHPGSTYRTEVDSFVLIMALGTGANITSFRADGKDGLSYYFGGYRNAFRLIPGGMTPSPGALEWRLTSVEDRLGNYVEIGWGEKAPSVIRYTGNRHTGAAPAFSIHFSPEYGYKRPDAVMEFKDGYMDELYSYIGGIRIAPGDSLYGQQPFYSFNLSYQDFLRTDSTHQPGLLKLQQVARSEQTPQGEKHTQMVFEWGSDAPQAAAFPSAPVKLDKSLLPVYSQSLVGDFNGDGRQDLLVVGVDYPSGTVKPTDNIYLLYSGEPNDLVAVETPFGQAGCRPLRANPERGISEGVLQTGDFNGDGRSDLLWYGYGDGDGAYGEGWYVALATGSGFAPAVQIVAQPPDSSQGFRYIDTGSGAIVGDFDGDGRDDVLVMAEYLSYPGSCDYMDERTFYDLFDPPAYSSGQTQWILLTSGCVSAVTFSRQYLVNPIPWYEQQDSRILVEKCDLDNDGKADLMGVASFELEAEGVLTRRQLKIFPLRNLGGGNFARMEDVLNLETLATLPDNYGIADPYGFHKMMGDVNGDGLDDIVYLSMTYVYKNTHVIETSMYPFLPKYWTEYESHGEWKVALSMGDGRFVHGYLGMPADIEIDGSLVSTFSRRDGTYNPTYNSYRGFEIWGVNLLDVNGDGRKDFVFYAKDKGWYAILASSSVNEVDDAGFDYEHPVALPWGQALPADLPWRTTTLDLDGNGREDLVFLGPNIASERGYHGARYLWELPALSSAAISTVYASLAPDPVDHRIVAVTNGLSSTTRIAYRPTTDESIYTPGAPVSYPIQEVRRPQLVVSDLYKDSGGDDPAGHAHFSYQYSGNRLDLSGRSPLGFHSFVTLDHQTSLFKYQFLTSLSP